MSEYAQAPKFGSLEWLEGLSRDERMAIVEVFAMYGDQTNPPVEHAALTHLRYLVAEVRHQDARIAELETRPSVADVVAWLGKKARECPTAPERQESAADAIARLADKVSRGAIRPTGTEAAS